MTGDTQQAITHVLQQDSKVLDTLFAKLKQLKRLNAILAQHLDPKLASRCQVANLDNHSLIVITDNAIWATQFRFQIPMLLAKLREHPDLYHLKNLSCKIRPAVSKPAPKEELPMARLSTEAAKFILEAAETIRDERLQGIMQKIAGYTKCRVD